MPGGYAISEYPDVPQVLADLDALISQPIRRLRPDALDAYFEDHFEKRCQSSKAMTSAAKEYIPGGVQHNLAFNMPFPLVITKASGCHLVDLDGNEYLDFLQAGGPTVLGSNPPEVLEQVIALLRDCGPSTGLFHEYELKLARFIADHMPAVPMFRMLGSGTEGCMAAIRVARLATGNKNVIKLGGAYHGWSDQLAYGLRIPGTRHHEAHGVPKFVFKHTQEVFPGDLGALERTLRLNRARGGTAAVLIEPVGPESGTRPVARDYNAGVRELCDRFGALLIFDEVVTGFRMGLGGAQGYFGVEPDLTVFGKVVAGGYPSAGGLGGKRACMQYLAAGIEAGSGTKKALVGGTMAANPLSSAAGYFTLMEIERQGAAERAGALGDRLTAGLRAAIARRDLPFVAYNQGSIVHLQTVGTMHFTVDFNRIWEIPAKLKEIKARKTVMEQMGAAYTAEGIITLAGSRLYTSAAHTEATIDQAIAGFDRVFANIEGARA
jgi:glutamate-1-semialdehyde 2,1-aminomutase